ncbi:MAG: hypothetical protein LBN22_10230 [Clostridiales Family XIII bacterium]|jgi:hypothetical protein|nr:hypothetical protein [Clostridiales Family XIII bacterium]
MIKQTCPENHSGEAADFDYTKDPTCFTAAYSRLAESYDKKWYARLIRDADAVTEELENLTDKIAADIIAMLVQMSTDNMPVVVTLSDPYAQIQLLGEARFEQFVIASQLRLLERLSDSNVSGIVRLCPYSFSPLEDYGLLFMISEDESYRNVRLQFYGHVCPHADIFGDRLRI